MYNICEIYTFDNIRDVGSVIGDFTKACKMLLDRGVTRFIIRTKNGCSNLCGEILNQYACDNIIDIDFDAKEYNPNDIKGYVILFNYFDMVALYDKSIMPMLLSKNFSQNIFSLNDFSNVSVME